MIWFYTYTSKDSGTIPVNLNYKFNIVSLFGTWLKNSKNSIWLNLILQYIEH